MTVDIEKGMKDGEVSLETIQPLLQHIRLHFLVALYLIVIY